MKNSSWFLQTTQVFHSRMMNHVVMWTPSDDCENVEFDALVIKREKLFSPKRRGFKAVIVQRHSIVLEPILFFCNSDYVNRFILRYFFDIFPKRSTSTAVTEVPAFVRFCPRNEYSIVKDRTLIATSNERISPLTKA